MMENKKEPSFTFPVSGKVANQLKHFESNPITIPAIAVMEDGSYVKVNLAVTNIIPAEEKKCNATYTMSFGSVSNYMVKKYGFEEAVKRKLKL